VNSDSDSIRFFFVPELGKTLAQMTPEEKNRISARGKLLIELRRYLESL
jgi:XTP/dITP diphosphohydrolase